MLAVVDAGQLYATIDSDDSDHQRSRAALEPPGLRLVIPALVITKVLLFIGQRLSPSVEARSLAGPGMLYVEAPLPEDWTRIAELVSTYRNFPLGGTDVSVVVLAEHLNTDLIITLDHRHFAAIRPRHPPAFRLLPE